jgi:MFS family permease
MNEHLDRKRLYHVGNLSIFMIGLGFAVRTNIAPDLQSDIYDKIDLANSAAMVGEALGITFTGFALTLLFGSALVDLIGMKRMLLLSPWARALLRPLPIPWWRRFVPKKKPIAWSKECSML